MYICIRNNLVFLFHQGIAPAWFIRVHVSKSSRAQSSYRVKQSSVIQNTYLLKGNVNASKIAS